MSKSLWPVLAIVAIALAIPASAQMPDRDAPAGGLARNDAECLAQFHEADENGDGFLNRAEVSESRSLIPTQLANQSRISRQDFLSACHATVESTRGG
jgi:hypothetical protein